MFTSLLVPLDASSESAIAVSPARRLAMTLGAEIALIRVVATSDARLSVLNSADLDHAHDDLEEVEVVVSLGDEADTIVAEAQSHGTDLIVMSTQARRLARQVLAHSRVPVMLVRGQDHQMERLRLILVPVDGSTGSLVALGAASRLARAARAAVVLLRVVVPLPLWIYDPTLGLNTGPLIDPRWDEDRRENAEAYVRRVAQKLTDSGIETGADAVLGEVAPAIAEYADQQAVDLIVMSTHARFGPTNALLGSVADQVVDTTRLPVLLLSRESVGMPTSVISAPEALH